MTWRERNNETYLSHLRVHDH